MREKYESKEGFEYEKLLGQEIERSGLSLLDKFNNFARFSRRQVIANFLNRYEVYKQIISIHGSIVECGVNLGQGLFSWYHFSSIFEPYNHSRRVIGFDSFGGFTNTTEQDKGGIYTHNQDWSEFSKKQSLEELISIGKVHDQNRVLRHIQKLDLVKGDATKTIPEFANKNPHLIVALLHLDFDVYPPTKAALTHLLPRMPKGAVVAFDELNDPNGPGETIAYLEELDIKRFTLKRNNFDSNLCYLVLE